jgi:low temperature requirement protein LtrA
MVLGGPALYLVGEGLFRLRVTGAANLVRPAVAALLVLLTPLGAQISALALTSLVAALLTALALCELRLSAEPAPAIRLELRHLKQQQQEGTS